MESSPLPCLTSHPDDIEWAARIAAGDEAALRALMKRHNQRLYRTARSILRDDAAAEDLVQEAYLLAYRSIRHFRGEASLSTWLIRIVVNLAIRGRQRQQRDAAMFSPTLDTAQDEVAVMDNLPFPPPESVAANHELRRLLETHIDSLPDRYREVFVLRGVEELSVEETAAALDMPEATVRTRYFRARNLLSHALAKDLDGVIDKAFAFDGERCDRIVAGVFARIHAQQL